jgi:hypothetical protein
LFFKVLSVFTPPENPVGLIPHWRKGSIGGVCWNYLYLSHKIGQEKEPERRQELLRVVQNGSVSSWGHVNLHGEYDFADEKMQDSIGLQIPPELALNLL